MQEIHAAQGFSGSGSESALLRTDAECLFHTRSAFIPQFYARNAVRQKAESPVTAAVTGLFPIHAPGFEKVPLESFSLFSVPLPRQEEVADMSALKNLDGYALRELASAIYVDAPDKSSGKRVQYIHIKYDGRNFMAFASGLLCRLMVHIVSNFTSKCVLSN